MTLVVPTLGLAAHGVASGSFPGATGIALCLFLGTVTGLVVDVASRLRGRGWLPLVGILTVAQGLAHLALSVGHDHHADTAHATNGHTMTGMTGDGGMSAGGGMLAHHLHALMTPWSADGAVMLLTHLVAVPLTAVVIALAAAVTGVATSVVAALRGPGPRPQPVATPPVAVTVVGRCPRVDRAAGPGVRGPPALLAPV
ncbi:hypothetical protein [Williamsia serinedens]|uniref:hypothetical protein n=1 Tax=Williamsia serinedens TaxID=391736 RepID=UPI0020A5460C|nr:hypothetical protein [Williamsia serinedens]